MVEIKTTLETEGDEKKEEMSSSDVSVPKVGDAIQDDTGKEDIENNETKEIAADTPAPQLISPSDEKTESNETKEIAAETPAPQLISPSDEKTESNETKEIAAETPAPQLISPSDEKTASEVEREVVKEMAAQAMSLDVAYQSLEMVRKVNLQVEFGKEVEDDHCIPCLRSERSSNLVKSKFSKWMSRKAAVPCLTCSSPVCNHHRCADFAKQKITICSDCAHLFSVNYLVTHVMHESDPVEKKKRLNGVLEVYDRALLVLMYSTQFIDEAVIALQGNTLRHNKIGLGSSATGVVAGGLGVAAACTIFTPVGPPLLLASILFGSGATAVSAGSEAVNYRCEPNKMADRVLTLHSIITNISVLPETMEKEEENEEKKHSEQIKSSQNQAHLHWTRAAMNGLKPLTAGALSAISIVTEARELKNTVDKIRAGNPCEKAERLAEIKNEIENLPKTSAIADDLDAIISRQRARAIEVESEKNSVTDPDSKLQQD